MAQMIKIKVGLAVDQMLLKLWQFAIDAIPGLVGGDVVININNETYSEAVILGKKIILEHFYYYNYKVLLTADSSRKQLQGSATVCAAGTGATGQGTVHQNRSFYWRYFMPICWRIS